MKKLDVENSSDYKEAEDTIRYLKVLKEYYISNSNFDKLELGDIKLRELFRFMSDHGFPKKGFISEHERNNYAINIDTEINKILADLKKARLSEIKDKELNSILIIPSWSKVIGYTTKGFFLNRPVLEIKRDAIIMLSLDILNVKDKFGTEFALLIGPGIFYTEFALDKGIYMDRSIEINMILLPMDLLTKVLDAPPIFTSDLNATMNELISIIPFSIIEEVATVQALLRGVISRNVFLPNKTAINLFVSELENPDSFNPKNGFKMMSAHPEYFNRLLLSQPPPQAKGDASFNITSAGIASILVDDSLLNEFFPNEVEKNKMLLQFKDLKAEFNRTGKNLISGWMV